MLNQIVAYLQAAGLTVYDTEVPREPEYPYVLVEAPATRQRHRRTLGGDGWERVRLIVTTAAKDATGVRIVAPKAKRLLEAFGDGERVQVKYLNGQSTPVSLDSDQNRYVFFCVDFYHITTTNN